MLHYTRSGTGDRKIIFVHGNSQSSACWNSFLENEKLTGAYTLVAVDLPGHGQSFRSENPEKDYSLKGMSAHLRDFLRAFEQDEYVLVGNSLGTNFFGEIADDLKNCKGMLLLGPCIIGKGLSIEEVIRPNPNVAACFIPHPTEEQLDLLIKDVVFHLSPAKAALIKNDFNNTDPAFRSAIAQSINQQEYTDEISRLEQSGIPLCIAFGKEEKIIFPDYLDKTGLRKWREQVFSIEEAGHFLQLDQPGKLAALLLEFAAGCFRSNRF